MRINPDTITGTLTGTGVANASPAYSFRQGRSVRGVSIRGSSTNTTDTIQVVTTRPGEALGTNTAAKINSIQGNAVLAVGVLTCPFTVALEANELGGDCDIYVFAGTQTGTLTYTINRMESHSSI